MEDWQLIQEYATRRSETAFCSLVHRYIGLVHAAALRQTMDPQMSDDVTQTVFVLLARKAATLGRGVVLGGWLYQTTNLLTDAGGRCEVPFPGRQLAAVGVLADGYEEKCVVVGGREPVPSAYTLKVPQGATIGGIVQDEAGHPVAGAAVSVEFAGVGDYSDREFQRERTGFPGGPPVAVTDASGHWTFSSASQTNEDLSIAVTQSNFVKETFGMAPEGLRMEDLRSGAAIMVLKTGLTLNGVVTDEQQNPIAGAKVSFGELLSSPQTTTTAEDGSFVLNHLAAGPSHLTATAEGRAPERMPVSLNSNTPPISVTLTPGHHLRLRVTDDAGRAVSQARVILQAWHGFNTLDWHGLTDANGSLEWNSAPPDEMNLCASAGGYCYSRANMITADGGEHTIVLHRQFSVSGSVFDAKSMRPISSFNVIPGGTRMNLVHGSNGTYEVTFDEYAPSVSLQFEAGGYDATDAPPLQATGSNLTCDISLNRTNPRDNVQGIVLSPDGAPAVGAEVALCAPGKFVTVGAGQFVRPRDAIIVKTDSNGEFSFPRLAEPKCVVALNQKGFGRVMLGGTNRAVSISLRPWGRVEGQLKLPQEPSNDRHVGIAGVIGRSAMFSLEFSTRSDADGRFVIDPAPPLPCKIYVYPPGDIGTLRYETPVDIQPGSTAAAQVGGAGCTLAGHFVLAGATNSIDWSQQLLFPDVANPSPKPPPVPGGLRGATARAWREAYWASDEGLARDLAVRHCTLDVQPDGSFLIRDVLPGTYVLTAALASHPIDPNTPGEIMAAMSHPLARIHQTLTVPVGESVDSILDIGEVAAAPGQ